MISSTPHYAYIAIEGVIGAGKTTLARHAADHLGAQILLEEFEGNPFLEKFYTDQHKFAFPLELSFLASRYHQLKSVLDNPSLFETQIVSDFVLFKSLVFASITLQDEESKLYRSLFDIMFQQMRVPDLLIYVYHPIERLRRNIKDRGRPYEQGISDKYLHNLNETYIQYFKQLPDHRIVICSGEEYDIVHQPDAVHKFNELLTTPFPLGMNYLI